MLKFFRLPFATTGDKTAVPDAVDSNGNVNYSQGYGFDYQRQKTDPAAKNIERDKMNQVLFDITTAIAELQSQGAPDFITSALNGGTAYSYAQFAIVKYSGALYISLVAANTALPSDATKWALMPTPALLQQSAYMSANAAGTVDAITAAFTPAIAALPTAPGTLSVFVRATGANTSTTPTFRADALAAKTIVKGNNVALLAGDIAGAGHWLELQYDPTLDKWVLQNPTHGFGGTPPQFDDTTKTATTAFVQRALGNFQSLVGAGSTPTTLTAADAGKRTVATSTTITLPLTSSVTQGSAFSIFAYGEGSVTVNRSGADEMIPGGGVPWLTTVSIPSGTECTFTAERGLWEVTGTGALKYSLDFGASYSGNGYQKLPGGLIIQWGSTGSISPGSSVTISFPVAFPNNCFSATGTLQSSSNSATPAASAVQVTSLAQLVVRNLGSATTYIASWIAVGN